eukprot:6031698-Prymnesium_polylepis.1
MHPALPHHVQQRTNRCTQATSSAHRARTLLNCAEPTTNNRTTRGSLRFAARIARLGCVPRASTARAFAALQLDALRRRPQHLVRVLDHRLLDDARAPRAVVGLEAVMQVDQLLLALLVLLLVLLALAKRLCEKRGGAVIVDAVVDALRLALLLLHLGDAHRKIARPLGPPGVLVVLVHDGAGAKRHQQTHPSQR